MKNLLIITDRYPYNGVNTSIFVKNQVDAIKDHFDRVIVFALSPIVPRFLARFPFMNPRWKRDSMVRNYSYDNVTVYFVKYFNLPFSFFKQRAGDICFKKVRRSIEDKKLDFSLIHAHFTYPSGYVGAKLKEVSGKPLVITGHGYDVYTLPFKSSSWRKKVKYVLQVADHLITPSIKNAKKMEELGISLEKISIIPTGYDSTLFHPMKEVRKSLDIPEGKTIILSVGNLEVVKGHIYLLDAMNLVHSHHPDVMCYIVGEGPERKKLESRIKELGLEAVVKLVGAKPHHEIPLWMNACDIFVLPSLNEGNPTVMFEVLGCGKPFVGTSVGGIPEIITDEWLGFLVPPANALALTDALIRALKTKWDAEYIINYAKQFSSENIAKRILAIYSGVLNYRKG